MATLEVRWFVPGVVPLEVQAWFANSLGTAHPSEERTDRYLSLGTLSKLNLKQRQNRLELKWRIAQLGQYWFSDRLQGNIERWQKWSSLPVIPPFLALGWVSVQKRRSQRQHRGLSYELTELTLKGRSWWSLAVESSEHNERELEQLVTEIFQDYPGPRLLSQTSFAYPWWLSHQ